MSQGTDEGEVGGAPDTFCLVTTGTQVLAMKRLSWVHENTQDPRTHELLRPRAERQASNTTRECDTIKWEGSVAYSSYSLSSILWPAHLPQSFPVALLTLLGRRVPLLVGLGRPHDRQ